MHLRRVFPIILAVVVGVAAVLGVLVYRAVGSFEVAVPAELRGEEAGALVSVTRTGKYPRIAVRRIVDAVGLPSALEVSNGITLYRVAYRTPNFDGSMVVASGLVALPNGVAADSAVSYQHGTSAQRDAAPSQPGLNEGLFLACVAAGRGQVLLAPDYIGLGESRESHPYMHADTMSSACVDFLRAAHALVTHLRGEWPSKLFLLGFSQGGSACFVVQRDLEALDDPRFQVTASAPVAGPFHLRDVSFPQAMTGETNSHAFYLSYLSTAYARIYDQSLESIVVKPYLSELPRVFDGEHGSDDIQAVLPEHPRELFTEEFLKAYDNGRPHWFLEALAENDVSTWTPEAPARIYYGDEDLDVLPEEALRAESAMSGRGADVTAISVGPYDHEGSALRAIPAALEWFDEFR